MSFGLPHVVSRDGIERADRDQPILFFDDLCEVIEEPNIDVA